VNIRIVTYCQADMYGATYDGNGPPGSKMDAEIRQKMRASCRERERGEGI
jgi:hypothetical protein